MRGERQEKIIVHIPQLSGRTGVLQYPQALDILYIGQYSPGVGCNAFGRTLFQSPPCDKETACALGIACDYNGL